MKRIHAWIICIILMTTCLNADQQSNITASTQQKPKPTDEAVSINGWNHVAENITSTGPSSQTIGTNPPPPHSVNPEEHTLSVNVKNTQKKVEPILKQPQTPPKIVGKELVDDTLNLTTAKAKVKPVIITQTIAQNQEPKINVSSQPKSAELDKSKQKSGEQGVLSGTNALLPNSTSSTSIKYREKQVAIRQTNQYFGDIEEYDITSAILNISNKRFAVKKNPAVESAKESAKQSAKQAPTVQRKIQNHDMTVEPVELLLYRVKNQTQTIKSTEKDTPTPPSNKKQHTQNTKSNDKVNIINKESNLTTKPKDLNQIKNQTQKIIQKEVDVKPVTHNYGKVDDKASNTLNLTNDQFKKKDQPHPKENPIEIIKTPKQQPHKNPIQLIKDPKQQPLKSLTTDNMPLNDSLNLIDTDNLKQEKKEDEFEGSKSTVLIICSLVIIGIAILKFIHWRKTNRNSGLTERRQNDVISFIDTRKETQSEVDSDLKNNQGEQTEQREQGEQSEPVEA